MSFALFFCVFICLFVHFCLLLFFCLSHSSFEFGKNLWESIDNDNNIYVPKKFDTPKKIIEFEKSYTNNLRIKTFLRQNPCWKTVPEIPFINTDKQENIAIGTYVGWTENNVLKAAKVKSNNNSSITGNPIEFENKTIKIMNDQIITIDKNQIECVKTNPKDIYFDSCNYKIFNQSPSMNTPMLIWENMKKNYKDYLTHTQLLNLFIKPIVVRITNESGEFVLPKMCDLADVNQTHVCNIAQNTKFRLHSTIGIGHNDFFLVYKELYECRTHRGIAKKSKHNASHYVSTKKKQSKQKQATNKQTNKQTNTH